MRIVKYGLALLFISCCIICFCSNSCRQASAAVDAKDSLIVINIDSLPNGPVPPLDEIFSHYSYVIDTYGSHFNEIPEWGYMMVTPVKGFRVFNLRGKVELYDRKGNFLRRMGRDGVGYEGGVFFSDDVR